MSKQPVVSTDSVAQDQIRAFVERILRMKEEAKAINDDIREIYAEAKGNGFDKTVLGQVVRHVEKHSKDHAAELEREALFDLYIAAFRGVGTIDATRLHTHEAVDHDPVAGEIIEHESAPADDGEGGGEDAPASLANIIRQDDPVDAVVGGTQPVSDRFHSEPGNGQSGVKPLMAPRQGGEEPGTLGSLSAAPSNIVRIQAKPLRPYCHPDHTGVCASPGGKVHCHRCEKLHAAGAREVVVGGKQIEHRGSINQ